jgi:hypothetical protein
MWPSAVLVVPLMVTIWVSVTVVCGRKMWLLDRTCGAMAFTENPHVDTDTETWVIIILQQMADGLMERRLDECRKQT